MATDSFLRSMTISILFLGAMLSMSTVNCCKILFASEPFLIGGYSGGIYLSSLSSDGSMVPPVQVATQASPSFLCLHPSLDVVYVVTETQRNDQEQPASVVAYGWNRNEVFSGKTPALTEINRKKIDGDIPCHVTVDRTGKWIVIANYINGSVVVFPIAADGAIESESCNVVHAIVDGKKASNAHCSAISPDNQWVLVCDLGLDRVFVYRLDHTTGKLSPSQYPHLSLPAGSGPRHLSFHPNGKFVYVINETDLTMTSANWNSDLGKLETINIVSTLPPNAKASGFSTAEVLVHPTGRFVFGSNRGHDSIVTMRIQPDTGAVERVDNASTQGKTPRNFRLSPDGKMLLAENQSSDTIYSFRVDAETGKLTATGHFISVKAPGCIKFLSEKR